MSLPSGTRLGPYEIVAPLGAGGMGEVYRARDTRLARDVAIKTLPVGFASDPERRARFESEALAVAALSHPNVLAIHDVGTSGDIAYAVMELIEGQTLRERLLEGRLQQARVMGLAIQIAQGLAAAHDKGITHRDLKPENLIVTRDGRIKILDFGLARREEPAGGGSQSMAPTRALSTEPGAVLGTTAYMSPEQVRGQVADPRSDIFALGAVIYEMLSGVRPFAGDTAAETMTAILREEPADLARAAADVSPALDRIVRRCLEKEPAQRFRSAADLAFALEAISSLSSGAHAALSGASAPARPRFRRITFRNGVVANARFTPDGAGLVFGASWDGRPFEIFTAHPGSPEARSLGLPAANLLSISSTGEMAISLGYAHDFWNQVKGTLARNALGGGGIRPLQKDVAQADWSHDGKSLALIRYLDGRCRLEYPAGNVLFETPDWISRARVSLDGKLVAFAYHPFNGDSQGDVCIVDAAGQWRVLSRDMTSVSGLAWSASGDEVWLSGINEAQQNGIWGLALDGSRREIYTSPARVSIFDVARDGRALIGLGNLRLGMSVSPGDGAPEIDLTWFDGTVATDLSADGRQVLFTEGHEAENPHYACYTRSVDGSPAVRLGDGISTRLSADGQWALAITMPPTHELVAHPIGFGEQRVIPVTGMERYAWAGFHPDGRRLFVVGTTADYANRLFMVNAEGGMPALLWDEPVPYSRISGLPIDPAGERVVFLRATGEHMMLDVATKTATPMAVLAAGDTALRFDGTGRFLFVANGDAADRRVYRVDLESGERTLWRKVAPPDRTGVFYIGPAALSADGSVLAYSYYRHIADLYVVEGLG